MSLPWVVVPPPHLMLVAGRCKLYEKVWRETLKLSAWHLKALEAMPIDWISPLETNLPFGSATRYPVSSEERLVCSTTLEYYMKSCSVQELQGRILCGQWVAVSEPVVQKKYSPPSCHFHSLAFFASKSSLKLIFIPYFDHEGDLAQR